MTDGTFEPAGVELERELESLRDRADVDAGVALTLVTPPSEQIRLRPVVPDDSLAWVPLLTDALRLEKGGVVGFTGDDASVAAQLAASAAAGLGDRGRSVVLVDACVDRPRLSKAMPEDGDEGLVDAVLFGVSAAVAARRTLASGVRLVTAGSHPLSSERVFDSDMLGATLRRLAEDSVVLVVVPAEYAAAAARAFDALAVSGGSTSVLAGTLSGLSMDEGPRTVAVLVGPVELEPERKAPGEAEAVAPAARESAEEPREERPEEPEEEPEEEPVLPVELPSPRRPEPTSDEEPQEERQIEPVVSRPEPSVVHEAVRERRRPARSRRAALYAALIVVAVVAGGYWIFVRAPMEAELSRREDAASSIAQAPSEAVTGDAGVEEASRPREIPAGEGEGSSALDDAEALGQVHEGRDEASEARRVRRDDEEALPPVTTGEGPVRGPGGPYRLMISSHRIRSAAEVESGELLDSGFDTEIIMTEVADRGTWYRVLLVGGYPTLREAREVLDTVKMFGYEGAWVEYAPHTE